MATGLRLNGAEIVDIEIYRSHPQVPASYVARCGDRRKIKLMLVSFRNVKMPGQVSNASIGYDILSHVPFECR